MSLDFEDDPRPADRRGIRLQRENPREQDSPRRRFARHLLIVFYGLAGLLHVAWPGPFLSITPEWVPMPKLVIALTGTAELLGAAGLLQSRWPRLRHAAGWGLALYALCVWPANFHHMALDLAKPGHGARLLYHIPRLAAQPLLIWLAPWAAGAAWPFRRKSLR